MGNKYLLIPDGVVDMTHHLFCYISGSFREGLGLTLTLQCVATIKLKIQYKVPENAPKQSQTVKFSGGACP